jgi:transposase-like protein
VLLDAIWVTLLQPAHGQQQDRLGRLRAIQRKYKVCVLVAVGVYPQSGRWGILGWTLAQGASQADWERLLSQLEARGVYRQRGLELLIHDGGGGLEAALKQVYPQLPHQRCLFHKLRNLRQAIVLPAGLTPAQRRHARDLLLRLLRAIFNSSDRQQARQLTDLFCARYADTQPKLTACLLHHWESTSLIFACWRVSPPGRAATYAPPVYWNGSIVPFGGCFGPLVHFIPLLAYWLLLPVS